MHNVTVVEKTEACRSKQVEEDIEASKNEIFLELNGLKKQSDAHRKKALIEVIINSQLVNMEVDTSAAIPVDSEKTCGEKVEVSNRTDDAISR